MLKLAGVMLAAGTIAVPIVFGQATNTFPASGSVGIGTTAPTSLFTVNSGPTNYNPSTTYGSVAAWALQTSGVELAAGVDSSGPYVYWLQARQATNVAWPIALNPAGGNVGINTVTPEGQLSIGNQNNYVAAPLTYSIANEGVIGSYWLNGGAFTRFVDIAAVGQPTGTNGDSAIRFLTHSVTSGASAVEQMRITGTGYVGIGTTSPAAKLDVNGSINISGAGGSITFPNGGGTQSLAWTGVLCGGDYAESVNAAGNKKFYEPGDVLVLTSDGKGEVAKSSEPYSTMVAGIFATKPGVIGKRQSLSRDADDLPMAMVGIVPAKVSAENGPIRRGDLLVSSSTPGYAMKGSDRGRLVGAVIGKAMGSLDSGTGMIEVLVTLQ